MPAFVSIRRGRFAVQALPKRKNIDKAVLLSMYGCHTYRIVIKVISFTCPEALTHIRLCCSGRQACVALQLDSVLVCHSLCEEVSLLRLLRLFSAFLIVTLMCTELLLI